MHLSSVDHVHRDELTDTTYPGYKQAGTDCNLYDHRRLSMEAFLEDTGYALASYVFYKSKEQLNHVDEI